VGVGRGDGEKDITYLASKLPELRIFEDTSGKFNLSLKEVGGRMLVVSQFTLYGDCRKGRRPSFIEAAEPAEAKRLYEQLILKLRGQGVSVETGEFQAKMEVRLINDGPVTILLDSRTNQIIA
jgi:D-tyrosyl-tRNA(Tyr) deacylase